MVKQKLTLSVEKDLVDFARHLGLNLSGFLEERLRELKQRLDTGTFTLRGGFEPPRNKSSTGSPGLRPTGLGDLSLGGY